MAKILGILTALILAISALIAIKNNARLEQEIEEEKTITAGLERNQADLKEKQATLKGLPDEIAAVEAETVEAEELATQMDEQGEELRKEIATKTNQIAENAAKLESARETLAQAADIQELISKLTQVNAETEQSEQAIANREAQLANLTAEAAEAEERAESLRQKVNSVTRGSSVSSLETRIRSIYPSWGFVTLASGTEDGVVGGSQLEVVRNNQAIAKLLVTTVERNSSSASIVPDSMADGVTLMIGDRVVAGFDNASSTDNN